MEKVWCSTACTQNGEDHACLYGDVSLSPAHCMFWKRIEDIIVFNFKRGRKVERVIWITLIYVSTRIKMNSGRKIG